MSLLLPLLALSACKVRVTVPEGGSVISASGAHDCAAGKHCVIDVYDTTFDETFTAKPAQGYRFTGWRKRHGGFCGGNTTPCRLATTGFEDNSDLMQILESDQVFYLEPVFESTEPGDLGNEHGSVCFNRALLAEGGGFETRYRSPGGNQGYQYTNYDQVVSGRGMLNGNGGRRALIVQETEGDPGSLAESEMIFTVNGDRHRVRYYGLRTQVSRPQRINAVHSYSPYKLVRWDLAAGGEFVQNYAARVERDGFISEKDVVLTTRYLGTETIAVPAGQFSTCRVEERYVETDASGVATETLQTLWYGVGSGILLKERSEFTDTEFVSGTVNGQEL
ncbi:hypothetical protein [Parahaliea mediterranea]|uniref:Bacterial repeat domain-containing protein n=1 Tax=Parahaliea mediterranea TaxID=651086 RepID=A0A939DHE4_9GAMM|nr:hypothetical protein [Parahaliea mediterranea]